MSLKTHFEEWQSLDNKQKDLVGRYNRSSKKETKEKIYSEIIEIDLKKEMLKHDTPKGT
jgi:hypothetical protein